MAAARLLLLGASGLVGGRVLDRLLDDDAALGPDAAPRAAANAGAWRVLAPSRLPLARQHPRLQALVVDPGGAPGRAALRAVLADDGGIDAMVCCLGTTRHDAGSAAAFAAIDRDLVVQLAGDARAAGAAHAIVVSSVGAAVTARGLYLRVKGAMEAEVAALGFDRCDFLRPGLLLGARARRRPLEAIAQRLAPALDPLLRGGLRRYRAIDAGHVAAAAVALLAAGGSGVHVHENPALEWLARTPRQP